MYLPSSREDFGFEKKNKKTRLNDALLATLDGPSDQSISPDEHSIVVTACRANSCDEKGFYWANDKEKTSAMAMIHYVYKGKFESSPQLFLASKNFKCGEYPDIVMTELKSWLNSRKSAPKRFDAFKAINLPKLKSDHQTLRFLVSKFKSTEPFWSVNFLFLGSNEPTLESWSLFASPHGVDNSRKRSYL